MTTRPTSRFRLHGRLDGFLPPRRRSGVVDHAFDGTPAVKDPIEALGVPHTEIGRVLLDGREVPWSRRIRGGEVIDVHPVESQEAGRPPRFALDVHLGRLAGYLRLIGIDTWYRNDTPDDALLATSLAEGRTLLSRDTGLLKRAAVVNGAFVHATEPLAQLGEVMRRFALAPWLSPFGRCSHCNGEIEPVDREDVATALPPRVRATATVFSRCRECGQAYWRGTHEARLRQRLGAIGIRI